MTDVSERLDLDPTGYNSRFWGCESPCERVHEMPDLDRHTTSQALLLDHVKWIHLGHGRYARDIREWENLLGALGVTIDELCDKEYHFKIPGVEQAMRATTKDELDYIQEVLIHQLKTNHRMWCRAPPPVVLVCTAEQVLRCAERAWIDSVRLEDNATLAREMMRCRNEIR